MINRYVQATWDSLKETFGESACKEVTFRNGKRGRPRKFKSNAEVEEYIQQFQEPTEEELHESMLQDYEEQLYQERRKEFLKTHSEDELEEFHFEYMKERLEDYMEWGYEG